MSFHSALGCCIVLQLLAIRNKFQRFDVGHILAEERLASFAGDSLSSANVDNYTASERGGFESLFPECRIPAKRGALFLSQRGSVSPQSHLSNKSPNAYADYPKLPTKRVGARMNPSLAMVSNGKKLMWDGRTLESQDEAAKVAEQYRSDSFEVLIAEEGGKFLVYTRRTVTAAPVAAQ